MAVSCFRFWHACAISACQFCELISAYVGLKSRVIPCVQERKSRKLVTLLGHHFQRQRSRSPGRFTHRRVNASGSCSGERWNVLAVGNYCYVAVCSAARGASAPTVGGEGPGHIVAAARL